MTSCHLVDMCRCFWVSCSLYPLDRGR